jgi:hypothetical protein
MSDPTEPEESTLEEFQDLIDDQVNGESDDQDDQDSNDSDDGDDG